MHDKLSNDGEVSCDCSTIGDVPPPVPTKNIIHDDLLSSEHDLKNDPEKRHYVQCDVEYAVVNKTNTRSSKPIPSQHRESDIYQSIDETEQEIDKKL